MKNRFADDVERFLSLISLEQREKLSEFGLDFVNMPVVGTSCNPKRMKTAETAL
jgi:hypothetical protein